MTRDTNCHQLLHYGYNQSRVHCNNSLGITTDVNIESTVIVVVVHPPVCTITEDEEKDSKSDKPCPVKDWHYSNWDLLWLLLWDYNMILIVTLCHGTLQVYYCESRDFTVHSVTF
jgi:hypothetical protein